MAEDGARLPSTGITPVFRGDSHLGNFGFYASPERDLVHRLRNEASLAALCGVAPVPASSGKITPHRLSRGGDRAANNALYRVNTETAAPKRRFSGPDPPQSTTTATCGQPDKPKTSPWPTVATHFGVPLITVSRLERGHQRNDTLANNYRQWLTAA